MQLAGEFHFGGFGFDRFQPLQQAIGTVKDALYLFKAPPATRRVAGRASRSACPVGVPRTLHDSPVQFLLISYLVN
jgi:hypothetical protein